MTCSSAARTQDRRHAPALILSPPLPACQPSPVHILMLMLCRTSSPTPVLPRVFFPPPVHMHTCVQSLIPVYSFTHLHFLSHPHELSHCSPYDAQQLSPTRPAGTRRCSPHSHVLCLQMPSPVTQLLLVQFSHVCVLSDTHLQSSDPEQDRHVSGLKMNVGNVPLL